MSATYWYREADRPEEIDIQIRKAQEEKRRQEGESEYESWLRNPIEWFNRYGPQVSGGYRFFK